MIYKAENIDTDKFLKEIQELQRSSISNELKKKGEIQKYYEGYRDALNLIENMFFCSNYEKKVEESNAK